MSVHLIPLNDSRRHDFETTCDCLPSVEFHNGGMAVIHDSFDGREELERAGIPTGKQWGVFNTDLMDGSGNYEGMEIPSDVR